MKVYPLFDAQLALPSPNTSTLLLPLRLPVGAIRPQTSQPDRGVTFRVSIASGLSVPLFFYTGQETEGSTKHIPGVRGSRGWGYSEQSWEGRFSPLPRPQILRNATQSLSREAAGRNLMDLEQPAALSPLEGREAAAEGAERKGEDRREREEIGTPC